MAPANPIDQEIHDALDTARNLIAEYVRFGDKYQIGESQNWLYGELLEFVNFRMETADTCMTLIEAHKVGDALGLSRSLLENYLLFKLMCRGTKFYRLQSFESKELTDAQFKLKVRELQEQNVIDRAAGKSECIEVRVYPRAKRHVMYVFEGLKDPEIEGFMIPVHYFNFKEFRPDTMRLSEDDYFVYYETPADLKKTLKAHMQEATFTYRHYLSYDALLACLALNGLSDKAVQARIDAHYTFLGKFLHPTHEAARDLHENSNTHNGKPQIGMGQTYAKSAELLAALYVVHLLADILDEVAFLMESAPAKYISDPGTIDIRSGASKARERFPYFWFIYNEPTLYDKYLHAIHHITVEELEKYGGYAGIPSEQISFNQHIYGQLQGALEGWHNRLAGSYVSPLVH